jgi:hypothetical protein
MYKVGDLVHTKRYSDNNQVYMIMSIWGKCGLGVLYDVRYICTSDGNTHGADQLNRANMRYPRRFLDRDLAPFAISSNNHAE